MVHSNAITAMKDNNIEIFVNLIILCTKVKSFFLALEKKIYL